MPKYKHGKQTKILSAEGFESLLKVHKETMPLMHLALLTAMFHSGCRISELLNLTMEKLKITDSEILLEIHRLKGSAQTPPLPIPLDFVGVKDYLLPWLQSLNHADTTPLFPLHRVTAQRIVKQVFGAEYYPHWFRLIKLTKIGHNPKTHTQGHMKSFSGIKTERAREAYLATTEESMREAQEANE